MSISSQEFTSFDEIAVLCSAQIHDALHELLRAIDYSNVLNTSLWDFAVECSGLRRLKLSNNDLRMLVRAGFVNYAEEIPSPAGNDRRFRRSAKLKFCKNTCFVLTQKGAAAARIICDYKVNRDQLGKLPSSFSPVAPSQPIVPKWDRLRQELKVGPVVVKRFKVPAASQEAILEAFEEEAWAARIDDPLSPRDDQLPKRRLQETIRSLNRNQKRPLLRFLGDGSGEGVLWQYCNEQNVVDTQPQLT